NAFITGSATPDLLSKGSEALTLAIMGSGAAADTVISKKDQGYSDQRAFILGSSAGLVEMVTEKIGFDALFRTGIMGLGKEGFKRYILHNMFAEGAEEGAADILNWTLDGVYDAITGTGESEWKRRIKELEESGKDEKEAFGIAVAERMEELGLDILGGALSGGIMAGVGSSFNAVQFNRSGAELQEMGPEVVQAIVDEGLASDPSTDSYRFAEQLQQRMAAGEQIGNLELGQLYQANVQAIDQEDNAEVILSRAAREVQDGGHVSNRMVTDILEDVNAVNRLTRETGLALTDDMTRSQRRSAVKNAIETLASTPPSSDTIGRKISRQDQQGAARRADVPHRVNAILSPVEQIQSAEDIRRAAQRSLGRIGAQQAVEFYNGDTAANDYYGSFAAYYQAGVQNSGADSVDTRYAGVLNAAQQAAAYQAGRADAAETLAREKQAAKFASVAGTDSGLVADDYSLSLDPDVADRIIRTSKLLGVRVRFVDSVRGGTANASISGSDILVEKNNPNPVMFILGHEWTHRLQALAPEEYRKFRDAVAADLQDAANVEQRIYAQQGESIDYEAALDEAVANYAGRMISDSQVLDAFLEQHRDDRTLLEKIRDAIRAIISKLTGAEKRQAQTVEAKLTATLEAAARQAQQLTETQKENAATEGGDVETKYSINPGFASDIQKWSDIGKPEGEVFILGSTGPVLQGLGAIESDIYLNGNKVVEILDNHPEMTLDTIKRIPELLDDPVLVLKSLNKGRSNKANTRLVMFGTVKAVNGSPVLTVLDLRPVEGGLVIDDMQKVNSAYTKRTGANFVVSSEVLHADKKRTIPLLRSLGLQYRPSDLLQSGSIGNISYSGTNVNISGIPFSSVMHTKFSMKDDSGTVYNRTAILSDSTVDRYLKDYASESSPKYAQAYIAYMRPLDYLSLTTSRTGRIAIEAETQPLDAERLANASLSQPIQLRINHESGDVEGHEGRHRMSALARAGVQRVPVLLFDSSNKYSKTALEALVLNGQDFGSSRSYAQSTVLNLQPLSYANRDAIIKSFATQPTNERIGERYGRETVRFAMKAPVEETEDLIALHNLSAEKLGKALNIGGFPMPSIAVTKTSIPHTNFGDITLVMDKSSIDPRSDYRNTVYSADAWTPTFPQIEYEANPTVAGRLHSKFYDLQRRYGREAVDALYSYGNYLEDQLDRYGGVDGIIAREKNNTNMKKVYLLDSGKRIPDPVVRETVTRLPGEKIAFYDSLIESLGPEIVNKAESLLLPGLREFFNEYETEIKDAHKKYYLENGATEADALAAIENTSIGVLVSDVKNAARYLKNGPETRKTETDYAATTQAIDESVDQADYEKWLHSLFDGAEKRSGVYNGKDRYTSSGNSRSFSATHYEVTLDNIARAMASQNDGNNRNVSGFYGVKSLRAGMAKRFSSIPEMHQYESRLQHLTEEQAEQITDALADRLSTVMGEIYDTKPHGEYDNSFIEMDTIGGILMEITEQKKITVDSVEKVFSKYRYKITNPMAERIRNLLFDVSQMPVNIFEAKPERAVRFDEVLAAIVPHGTNAELMQRLRDAGVQNILEYEKDNESDRLAKVNSVEGARFSIKHPVFSAEEIEDNKTMLKTMSPVSTLTGNEFAKGEKDLMTQVLEYFSSLDNSVYSDQFGDVGLSKSSWRSERRHGMTTDKAISFAAVPDVIKRGTVIDIYSPEGKPGVERIVVAAPVMMRKQLAYVGVMLQRDARTQRLYLHDVVSKSNQGLQPLTQTRPDAKGSQVSRGQARLDISTILLNALGVNTDEKTRFSQVNAATENIRTSLKGSEQDAVIAELQRQNESLRERVDYWRGQTHRSDRAAIDPKAVKKAAQDLVKSYSVRLNAGDMSSVVGELQSLYDYISHGGDKTGELTWEDAYRRAYDLSDAMIESAVAVDDELYTQYEELRDYARTHEFTVSPADSRNIPDFND
ncbi:MAG: hypothetical protein IJL40_05085, partial [Oscillospiraceae bacterium]|nr:hypothetical protein [Oscillospiraceae bacterium]